MGDDCYESLIDARLRSGEAGGLETVLIGLASGLASLGDGDESYRFLVHAGATDWLEPFLGGPADLAH